MRNRKSFEVGETADVLIVGGGVMGLSIARSLALRRILVPQALKVIIPPTGNQFISMLKTTSLLFTIAVPEIFGRGTDIYSQNFKYFEVLCVVSIWYLVLTYVLTAVQQGIERRFGVTAREPRAGVMSRIFGTGFAGGSA